MQRTTIVLIILCIVLALCTGYLYRNQGRQSTSVVGHVIEIPVDLPPVYIQGPAVPYPVKDTTDFQKYLDSLLRQTEDQKDSAITSLSQPFNINGEQGIIKYDITAFPQLNMRTIEAIFDVNPFKVDTTLMDTTLIVKNNSDWYVFTLIGSVVTFILLAITGGL